MKKGSIKFNDKDQTISVELFLVSYKDESGVHYVYSPQLDLHGYGNDEKEAMEHFKYAMEDFIDYTTEHDTLGKVLNDLGWKRDSKSPASAKKMLRSKEVANIISSYTAQISSQKIDMPLEFAN